MFRRISCEVDDDAGGRLASVYPTISTTQVTGNWAANYGEGIAFIMIPGSIPDIFSTNVFIQQSCSEESHVKWMMMLEVDLHQCIQPSLLLKSLVIGLQIMVKGLHSS